jgi:hypothetical protein
MEPMLFDKCRFDDMIEPSNANSPKDAVGQQVSFLCIFSIIKALRGAIEAAQNQLTGMFTRTGDLIERVYARRSWHSGAENWSANQNTSKLRPHVLSQRSTARSLRCSGAWFKGCPIDRSPKLRRPTLAR